MQPQGHLFMTDLVTNAAHIPTCMLHNHMAHIPLSLQVGGDDDEWALPEDIEPLLSEVRCPCCL